MSDTPKTANWQDWSLLGLRVVFLALVGIWMWNAQTPQGAPQYASNDITIALLVGVVAAVLFGVLSLFPAAHKALPLALIAGDWATALALIYFSRGDASLMIAAGGILIVTGMLRLGAVWGAVQAIGVMVAAGIALSLVFGADQFALVLPTYTQPFLILGMLAVATGVSGYALTQQLHKRDVELAELHKSRTAQLTDMRERTRAIYEMAATLSQTLEYEKILLAALNAGALGLRESSRRGKERLVSVVLLVRAKDNALYVVTGRGLVDRDKYLVIPGQSGIIGQALTQGIPVFGNDAKKDPELQYFLAFQDIRSVLCIPLRAGFDSFGVLLYGSDQPNAFSDEHTEMLTAIGIQATVALQNAMLYRNLLEERDRIVEVEEDARKKLARDLHDGPTQSIAAIAMRMGIIYKMLERTPAEVPAELKKVEELARRTTKEIRHMLFTLRPLVLENQGLNAALEQLAEKMKETHNQNVAIRMGRDVEKVLDGHQQGVLFYIIEEAVGNARKHAEAELISVGLYRQEDVVVVKIADNGKGFDLSKVTNNYDQRGSLGMVNMRERAQLLDATLNIDSAPGQGTTITIIVPIKDAAAVSAGIERSVPRRPLATTSKLAVAVRERLDNL
ncbi:MAG: GAF domain-containing sensor histidine kinase [Chloroflexi bacterium]|nr:GAF domain-containing sensor histidine kinase [Chloroflexota bacterium]